MRYSLALLALLAACGKSAEQRQRELTICIGAGTDESRGVTDPYKVGECLDLRYEWSTAEIQDAQVRISVIERQMRAERDSIARARRKRRK